MRAVRVLALHDAESILTLWGVRWGLGAVAQVLK